MACVLILQQYILYKRSLDIWILETRPFPLDVDNAIVDTFECLRPKLTLFTTLEEANADVEELEKEFVQKLGEKLFRKNCDAPERRFKFSSALSLPS